MCYVRYLDYLRFLDYLRYFDSLRYLDYLKYFTYKVLSPRHLKPFSYFCFVGNMAVT